MSQQIHKVQVYPDLRMMSEMTHLERFDAAWSMRMPDEDGPLRLLAQEATIQSVGSAARMTGAGVSDDEIENWVVRGRIPPGEDRERDIAIGYLGLYDGLLRKPSDFQGTPEGVLSIHRRLMARVGAKDDHAGTFKTKPNELRVRIADWNRQLSFKTTPPGEPTAREMSELLAWQHEDRETPVLLKAALFLYEFLCIHPFQEGNEQMSFLLTRQMLLGNGADWLRYASLERTLENRKEAFFRTLMQTQRNRPGEDATEWVHFFLSCLSEMQSGLRRHFDKGRRIPGLTPRQNSVRLFVELNPGSSSGAIALRLGIPLPTVKKALQDLGVKGLLIREGKGRGTFYSAL